MGASLLAMAVGQSIKVLNVNPPSRAGSLPQGMVGDTEFA
ncbi:manganese ABC transporter ATP-binding protein, partial [Pseudomonas sp. FW305-3-2-15-A-R2A1]